MNSDKKLTEIKKGTAHISLGIFIVLCCMFLCKELLMLHLSNVEDLRSSEHAEENIREAIKKYENVFYLENDPNKKYLFIGKTAEIVNIRERIEVFRGGGQYNYWEIILKTPANNFYEMKLRLPVDIDTKSKGADRFILDGGRGMSMDEVVSLFSKLWANDPIKFKTVLGVEMPPPPPPPTVY